MRLLDRERWALVLVTAGALGLTSYKLSFYPPGALDSALFGPVGASAFTLALTLQNGGYLCLALIGLYPSGGLEVLSPVPSAAPLHVLGLLGAGFFDLSSDNGLSASPVLSLAALLLGGLWSRRLGPHKEVWSWDVVEITAVDLLASEIAAEHFWQKRPLPLGVAWGGGELRLFRNGLAASHHHLSTVGSQAYAGGLWYHGLGALSSVFSYSAAYLGERGPKPHPVRLRASRGPNLAYGAPSAFGETTLAAWALALLAPSSGAIAAWGLWGAPLYLWFVILPPLIYLGALPRSPLLPLWTHLPLTPLSHVFATPMPWAPTLLLNRFALLKHG